MNNLSYCRIGIAVVDNVAPPPENHDEAATWVRSPAFRVALEFLVPAIFMAGLWILGPEDLNVPLSTTFSLAVGCFCVTWLIGHRVWVRFEPISFLKSFVPLMVILGIVGEGVVSSRFPELTLEPLPVAAVLTVASIIANEVTSAVGFTDFAIMLTLGFIVPQIAFSVGVPNGIWGKFLVAFLVLVPLSVLVFNRGIDEDVGAQAVTPLVGLALTTMLGTANPQFEIGPAATVVGGLIFVRFALKVQARVTEYQRVGSLLMLLVFGLVTIDPDAAREAVLSPIKWFIFGPE